MASDGECVGLRGAKTLGDKRVSSLLQFSLSNPHEVRTLVPNIMTDGELLAATWVARGRAHRAPFAEYSMDHTKHTAIVNHTGSWAQRSAEWVRLAEEVDRRGLAQPTCDCPDGAHFIPASKGA